MSIKIIRSIIFATVVCYNANVYAQKITTTPDLSNIKIFSVTNRNISIINNDGKTIVHLDAKPGDGIAWIKNSSFAKGVIEFDVRGKDLMQQSFVGIAFCGINDSTFDAVYFRPFNFQSNDTLRKKHSVQYISLPKYDWSILRETHPGVYENSLKKNISPENWIHIKIFITNDDIKVYINDDNRPSLVVKPIGYMIKGKIGFWVGNNSDGDFSNLVITVVP